MFAGKTIIKFRHGRACLKNNWLKKNLWYPLSKIVVLISLNPEFLEKKNKKTKKTWFLVNSSFFCFAFHANLMSDGKKRRLKFLFITSSILLINMSISLFRWTVQVIKTQKLFATKTTKLCSIILVSSIYKFINPWKYRS